MCGTWVVGSSRVIHSPHLSQNFPKSKISPPEAESLLGNPLRELESRTAFGIVSHMTTEIPFEPTRDLPFDPVRTEATMHKYIKLMNLHRELASHYRSKSKDRRTIANLWYHIDGLELDLRADGVAL